MPEVSLPSGNHQLQTEYAQSLLRDLNVYDKLAEHPEAGETARIIGWLNCSTSEQHRLFFLETGTYSPKDDDKSMGTSFTTSIKGLLHDSRQPDRLQPANLDDYLAASGYRLNWFQTAHGSSLPYTSRRHVFASYVRKMQGIPNYKQAMSDIWETYLDPIINEKLLKDSGSAHDTSRYITMVNFICGESAIIPRSKADREGKTDQTYQASVDPSALKTTVDREHYLDYVGRLVQLDSNPNLMGAIRLFPYFELKAHRIHDKELSLTPEQQQTIREKAYALINLQREVGIFDIKDICDPKLLASEPALAELLHTDLMEQSNSAGFCLEHGIKPLSFSQAYITAILEAHVADPQRYHQNAEAILGALTQQTSTVSFKDIVSFANSIGRKQSSAADQASKGPDSLYYVADALHTLFALSRSDDPEIAELQAYEDRMHTDIIDIFLDVAQAGAEMYSVTLADVQARYPGAKAEKAQELLKIMQTGKPREDVNRRYADMQRLSSGRTFWTKRKSGYGLIS